MVARSTGRVHGLHNVGLMATGLDRARCAREVQLEEAKLSDALMMLGQMP